MNLFNKVLLVKIYVRSINAEMVVQTEGWSCDDTECEISCMARGFKIGNCEELKFKHLNIVTINCICRAKVLG
jgi:hypothetical protein